MFRNQLWMTVLAAVVASALLLTAEEKPKADRRHAPAAQSAKKPVLADAVRVSTAAAARDAAKEQTKLSASDQAKKDEAGADVLEFHPAAASAASPPSVVGTSQTSKKSPVKNIHGTVYGSTTGKGAASQNAGAAVGASSKSGKTSIYLETERSRTTPPR